MNFLYKAILLITVILSCGVRLYAVSPYDNPPDSTFVQQEIAILREYAQDTTKSVDEKNNDFYADLKERAQKNKFANWLHGMLIKTPRDSTKNMVVDEQKYYAHYEGKSIVSIDIYTRPIFDKARSKLQKGMEYAHVQTWKATIRRDLLFKVGDEIDADLIVRTLQLLKSRKYLYDVRIILTPYPEDPSAVIVQVITRDRWTIGVDGMLRGLTGRIAGDIYDHNIIGSGNRLRYRTSFNWKDGTYEGSLFQYYIPNMLGSFFEGDFTVGRSFWRTAYLGSANKSLLLPDDYMLGVKGGWEQTRVLDVTQEDIREDNEYLIFANKEFDIWGGKSFYIESLNSSLYAMGRYHSLDFTDVPVPVGPELNPYFHDRRTVLGSLGMYKQNYMAANLVYGYGFREYVPVGYMAEVNGGYSWQEFGEGWYAGVSARAGGFTPIGYFMGGIRAGSYFGFGGRDFYRTALNLDMTYFTNLIDVGPNHQLRQFVNLNLMMGWNRSEGVNEYLRLTRESGPRYFHDFTIGRNRMVLNTETVLFTPWNPLGFRVALFGFVDVGLIGDNYNFFRNNAYSTVGLGIRLKNERLVFSTIELSFTVGFGKGGLMRTEYVRLGGEKRITIPAFIPDKPQIVEYQ